MKASIRGTEIYFDVAGMQLSPTKDGFIEKPVIFLLHGGPGGSHLRYKLHSLELQDVAQLIFIDHRGCGFSKKTKTSEYTLENNIEDVEALRKHLGLKKICILGTSYGGMVAQGYAIRYPKNLEKLILAVTAPSYHFLEEAKNNLYLHGTPEQIKVAEPLWNGGFKNNQQLEMYQQVTNALYSTKAKKISKKMSKVLINASNYQALNQGFCSFLKKFDYISQLHKIICPTLVLAGENDWICPPSESKLITQKIKNSQLKIFKNCGHSIAIDAHQAYIKAIKKFLNK